MPTSYDFSTPGVKHLSASQSAFARQYLRGIGVAEVEQNSRFHVFGRKGHYFWKSLTDYSAQSLNDFYGLLQRSANVPQLVSLQNIGYQVWIAQFEVVPGRPGCVADSRSCLLANVNLQMQCRHPAAGIRDALLKACTTEIRRWDEIVGQYDVDHWRDERIVKWSGVSSGQIRDQGTRLISLVAPALEDLVAIGPHERLWRTPVHADLAVSNFIVGESRSAVIDWDEAYWGLPGMGFQILLEEAGEGSGRSSSLLRCIIMDAFNIDSHDFRIRTLAGCVLEFASIHHSLIQLCRPVARKSAYLAAWACRYRDIIDPPVYA